MITDTVHDAIMDYGMSEAALRSVIECRMPADMVAAMSADRDAAIAELLEVCRDYFNRVYDGAPNE